MNGRQKVPITYSHAGTIMAANHEIGIIAP